MFSKVEAYLVRTKNRSLRVERRALFFLSIYPATLKHCSAGTDVAQIKLVRCIVLYIFGIVLPCANQNSLNWTFFNLLVRSFLHLNFLTLLTFESISSCVLKNFISALMLRLFLRTCLPGFKPQILIVLIC
jgi:hypothetical protein